MVGAMATVENAARRPAGSADLVLRPHRAGDMGWVPRKRRALRAGIRLGHQLRGAGRAKSRRSSSRISIARRERCWIAEIDGERVGSVFVVRKTDAIAKLRLLIIDPKARGLGLGKRLVEECLRFAQRGGLFVDDAVDAEHLDCGARRSMQRAGFRLVAEEPHHSFGVDLIGETLGARSLNRTALAVRRRPITGRAGRRRDHGDALRRGRDLAGLTGVPALRDRGGVSRAGDSVARAGAPTVPQPPPPHSPSKTGVNALSLGEVDRPQAGREGVSGTSLRNVPPPHPSPASGGGRRTDPWGDSFHSPHATSCRSPCSASRSSAS